ncbi:MAG: phosphoribosylglycinamide formyltransferase [Desulfococcaceae bacterium]
MNTPIRVGALISGGGTNLQAIIDACESGALAAQMVFVGTDNPKAAGLARAERAGIPAFVVDYHRVLSRWKTDPTSLPPPPDLDIPDLIARQRLIPPDAPAARRDAFLLGRVAAESALLREMERFPFDLLVLAGFMRVVTPYFLDRVNRQPDRPRVMNIHPALLPTFPGTDGYGDTVRYGCKVAGCTVHFVDYGEDTGPIIGQRAFPVLPEDTLDSVRKKGLAEEWRLYPECIQLFAENRLRVERPETGGRPVVRILPPPG